MKQGNLKDFFHDLQIGTLIGEGEGGQGGGLDVLHPGQRHREVGEVLGPLVLRGANFA